MQKDIQITDCGHTHMLVHLPYLHWPWWCACNFVCITVWAFGEAGLYWICSLYSDQPSNFDKTSNDVFDQPQESVKLCRRDPLPCRYAMTRLAKLHAYMDIIFDFKFEGNINATKPMVVKQNFRWHLLAASPYITCSLWRPGHLLFL